MELNKKSEKWTPHYAERMNGIQASEIRELLKIIGRPGVISFAGGIPDPGLFPNKQIHEAYALILGNNAEARKAFQYSISEGDQELRHWIVEHMRQKGVGCEIENILITSGSQQALEFLGKLFISPGNRVYVTAPTYLGALQAFAPNQPTYGTLKIAANGTVSGEVASEEGMAIRNAFSYVVPDFSNPTGETLTEESRLSILDFSTQHNMPIIEDSPYEALRFDGVAEPSIQALDIKRCGNINDSRVFHCGSFSKIFMPGLRIGWVCAAKEIINRLTIIKQSSDLNSPAINQKIILHLARNYYDIQVEKACSAYREKRDVMLSMLGDILPEGSHWSLPDGGMFVWVELPIQFRTADILPRAVEDHGVAFVPGNAFFATGGGTNMLRLSYAFPSIPEIETGLIRLRNFLSSER